MPPPIDDVQIRRAPEAVRGLDIQHNLRTGHGEPRRQCRKEGLATSRRGATLALPVCDRRHANQPTRFDLEVEILGNRSMRENPLDNEVPPLSQTSSPDSRRAQRVWVTQ